MLTYAPVLVLNQNYQPFNVCNARRAFVLLGLGKAELMANGRGDIDLVGYIRVLHENGYTGPVNLEVIGTKRLEYSLEQCCIVGAETRGHMQACLQACGAR